MWLIAWNIEIIQTNTQWGCQGPFSRCATFFRRAGERWEDLTGSFSTLASPNWGPKRENSCLHLPESSKTIPFQRGGHKGPFLLQWGIIKVIKVACQNNYLSEPGSLCLAPIYPPGVELAGKSFVKGYVFIWVGVRGKNIPFSPIFFFFLIFGGHIYSLWLSLKCHIPVIGFKYRWDN